MHATNYHLLLEVLTSTIPSRALDAHTCLLLLLLLRTDMVHGVELGDLNTRS
jgi:hypothetical protein